MPDTPRSTGGTWEDYKDAFPAGKNITEGSPTMTDTRPMLGPLIERIDRRLTLIEASNRLTYITVDEMTDALLDVRLGCEGADAAEQRRNTRYYAERLLRRLAGEPLHPDHGPAGEPFEEPHDA